MARAGGYDMETVARSYSIPDLRSRLKHYSTTDFQVFLPPSTANVGDVWDLDPNRILPFLRQFHPGATMNLKHNQNGAKGVLTGNFA